RSVSTAVANAAPAVFFDFDKYNLDNEAQQEVYKAAQILKANPNLLCEVRAYCDVVGSDKYNKQLSINRANRVKDELVKVYGISPSRIVANGNGRILEPNYKYRINRRAEFHFSE
ncbi:MAG: OmpA family protein, partial [Prevotellaceae bacterium]|nr:OmpA family protein [Prevotellaceae bacterium]